MTNLPRNNLEVSKLFTPLIEQAVDYVMQKIWNENRETIRLNVYEQYDPVRYNRTGEFRDAWSSEIQSNTNKGKVQGEFFFDANKLTPGDDNPNSSRYGQHVSAIDRTLIGEALAEIIFEGKAGPAFGHGTETGAWHEKRDAWEHLVKKVGDRNLKKWMGEGLEKAGLKIQSHGTSLGKI